MDRPCIAFEMTDANEAYDHLLWCELIMDYKGFAFDNCMYAEDDGWRRLYRCKSSGGMYMVQHSEGHFMSHDDEEYDDYFPIGSIEEAESICKKWNGDDILRYFPKRFLHVTGYPLWKLASKLLDEEKCKIKSKYNGNYTWDS